MSKTDRKSVYVLYDGDWHLCKATVRFLKPRFRNECTPDIKFRGIQYIIDTADQVIDNDDPDYELYKEYDDFIHNTLDFSTVWVINMSQNQVYDKSDAFIHLTSKFANFYPNTEFLRFPWNTLGAIRIIPKWVRNGVYNIIARLRR